MSQVELVQTRTADGLLLHGSLALPQNTQLNCKRTVDAALCLHGTGSNFYSGSVFDGLSPKLLADGIAVLRVNTRGHDGVNTTASLQGAQRLGATFERVEDCRHDVVAWLEFLSARGFRSAVIIGHSLGAIKALYATLRAPHPLVTRLIAVSPPRLSHSFFIASERRDAFLAEFANATDCLNAGRADQILDVKIPLPFLFAAASYIDKYGPEEKFNFLRRMDGIKVPTLFTFGSVEVEREMAFRGLPEAVAGAASPTQPIRVVTIAGANHVYTGQVEELSYKIRSWLACSA